MTARLESQADGADGARRADGLVPFQAVQSVFNTHDLQTRCGVGLCITGRGDLAVAEIALGKAHAAHLQAFTQQRLEALPDDEFGTATADIGHQAFARGIGQGVRHAEVDQARFFTAGNHLYGVAQDFLGAADEFATVTGFTQGVGADDTNGPRRHAIDQLGKALEAIEPALHGLFVELTFFVYSGGQLNFLAQPFKNADLTLIGFGYNHVEAVRAQVDGGDQGQILGCGLRHGQRVSVDNRAIVPRTIPAANAKLESWPLAPGFSVLQP